MSNVEKSEYWDKEISRRSQHRKQQKLNTKIKKRLYKNIAMAPCRYCLNVFLINQLTVEHIIPLCLNGSNNDDNIGLACKPCNQQKGKESWLKKREVNRQKYKLLK